MGGTRIEEQGKKRDGEGAKRRNGEKGKNIWTQMNADFQDLNVGAAPSGRPQYGQPQRVAPTVSVFIRAFKIEIKIGWELNHG